jgi:hypothetical protein
VAVCRGDEPVAHTLPAAERLGVVAQDYVARARGVEAEQDRVGHAAKVVQGPHLERARCAGSAGVTAGQTARCLSSPSAVYLKFGLPANPADCHTISRVPRRSWGTSWSGGTVSSKSSDTMIMSRSIGVASASFHRSTARPIL